MQLFVDNDADEFNPILNRERVTKILITTSRFNSSVCVSLFSFFLFKFFKVVLYLSAFYILQSVLISLFAERTSFYIRATFSVPKCTLL